MNRRPKILIVASNPRSITDDWVKARFAGQEVEILTYDELKMKEPCVADLMIWDDLSALAIADVKKHVGEKAYIQHCGRFKGAGLRDRWGKLK